jgi:hypothetical protein
MSTGPADSPVVVLAAVEHAEGHFAVQRWAVVKRAGLTSLLRYAALLGLYVILTLVMTQPVYQKLTEAVIGSGDSPQQTWAYWWTNYALTDLGRWPLTTNYQFHPQELGATSLMTLVSYNTLLSIPLQIILGLFGAINLIVLSSLVLSGFCAYFLIRHETGNSLAAFVGSLMFAFPPAVFARLTFAHFSTVGIWPTPLIMLCWLIALRSGSLRAALGAGVLLGFQCSIGPYQGSYDIVLMIVLALVTSWQQQRQVGGHRGQLSSLVRVAALTCAALAVVFSPHLIGALENMQQGLSARSPLSHSNSFAPDLLAYFTPSPRHPQLGALVSQINSRIGSQDPVRVVFPGFLAIALGLAATVRSRGRLLPWTLGLAVMFLFSLGPLLHLNGETQFKAGDLAFTIPLPFILLWHIPFLGEGRVTANMTFSVSLCLAVLSGHALASLFSRLRRASLSVPLAGILALVVLYEGLSTPINMERPEIPKFYNQLAAEPGDGAVLEVPVGWRDARGGFGEMRGEYLYYATVHHKPLVDGYVARASDENFKFYSARPALGFIVDPSKEASPEAMNRDAVVRTLKELRVRYVIVHPHQNRDRVSAYLQQVVGLAMVYSDDQTRVYGVD